ncbi:ABC transporter substrate-binding protein [Bradyrhizobium sp. 186]|uniref:ABC transporter substrate-binding protein n=1 Tax=Bradyrhizobium sp. 186 TaxID=2782654 RepID=UPI00200149A4|nr:ABC transporter substrate-binding protein [Bradyrhizobium sp. 186]UPK36623.1 ABC transporter substrate-binding protein [Bradyrhizobium sp. 186]
MIGITTICGSLAAHAQTGPARLAFMGSGAAESSAILLEGLKTGLRENGLAESKDYIIDVRWANGAYERFPAFARELAQSNPRVILVTTIAAARAAQQLVPSIPVVMTGLINPVDTGLIKSLARPGGNTTGVSSMIQDITTKSLEFLLAVVPKASVVAALYNPANPTNRPMFAEAQHYAAARGLKLQGVEFKSLAELDATFEEVKNAHPDALLIISDATLIDLRERIAAFALQARIPTSSSIPEMTDAGALVGYGPPRREFYRRSATYVKKILDGANPADLPVEQPTLIEMSINLRTAKILEITVPEVLSVRADRVIE